MDILTETEVIKVSVTKRTLKITKTTFLILALLIVVFGPSFPLAAAEKAPEGMVYCPLTHRYQPIDPPEEKPAPFDQICASTETKNHLLRELFVKNLFKSVPQGQEKLEDLAFDFLQQGKAALRDLPGLPDLPSKDLAKNATPVTIASTSRAFELELQAASSYRQPALLARPPTGSKANHSPDAAFHHSGEISRHLAPRAPPLLS